jgi:phage regulator Rha-like protein
MRALSIPQITMSSLEIAELVDKNHADVLRDIRNMLVELGIGERIFAGSYLSTQNKALPCFNLPRREVEILLTGYSIKLRARVIDRLNELENRQQLIPQTLPEALRLAASLAEERDEAIRTKAEIGSRREATAMNTAAQAVKRLKRLERERDRERIYCTIRRATVLCPNRRFDWRVLRAASMGMEQPPIDVHDDLYGTVKSYHADVWLACYGIDVMQGGGHE